MESSWIKSPADIEKIGESGRILAEALQAAIQAVRPGVPTSELNRIAEESIRARGGRPSFKNYGGPENPFPAGLCVSVNDVVVHGLPSKSIILKEGDLAGLDLGVEKDGFFADAAVSVPVGRISPPAQKLLRVTRQALEAAIFEARVGNRIGDISYAIQSVVESAGMSVVRDLIGHGVGYAVHEDPAVPCFGRKGTGPELVPGMVLAIEPMVILGGSHKVIMNPGEWPVRTADGSLAAHFEHTVAILPEGPRILTLL